MNEPFDEFNCEFARPRANTCPTGNMRRPRRFEFTPSPGKCDSTLRVPSPPEGVSDTGIDIARCLKSPFQDGMSTISVCHSTSNFEYKLDEALENQRQQQLYSTTDATSTGLVNQLTPQYSPSMGCGVGSNMAMSNAYPIASPSSSQEGDGIGSSKKKRRNPWGSETYAELISKAIEARPDRRATLQQIYKFIISYNKFFRDRSDGNLSAGWKNSIRHNLSLQAKFVKVGKTLENSKSSYWTIDDQAVEKKTYLRRRCVTLDKHSEAAARKKLMHRRELFNEQMKKKEPPSLASFQGLQPFTKLKSGMNLGDEFTPAVTDSFGNQELPLDNVSPSSFLSTKQGDQLRPDSMQSLTSKGSEATSSVYSYQEQSFGKCSYAPPSDPAPNIMDLDASLDIEMNDEDFEKAQLELALLVAECCYMAKDEPECKNPSPPSNTTVDQSTGSPSVNLPESQTPVSFPTEIPTSNVQMTTSQQSIGVQSHFQQPQAQQYHPFNQQKQSFGMYGTPYQAMPNYKVFPQQQLLFQQQQQKLLPQFSFDEFLQDEKRQKAKQQQKENKEPSLAAASTSSSIMKLPENNEVAIDEKEKKLKEEMELLEMNESLNRLCNTTDDKEMNWEKVTGVDEQLRDSPVETSKAAAHSSLQSLVTPLNSSEESGLSQAMSVEMGPASSRPLDQHGTQSRQQITNQVNLQQMWDTKPIKVQGGLPSFSYIAQSPTVPSSNNINYRPIPTSFKEPTSGNICPVTNQSIHIASTSSQSHVIRSSSFTSMPHSNRFSINNEPYRNNALYPGANIRANPCSSSFMLPTTVSASMDNLSIQSQGSNQTPWLTPNSQFTRHQYLNFSAAPQLTQVSTTSQSSESQYS